jgi:hypothetical protein
VRERSQEAHHRVEAVGPDQRPRFLQQRTVTGEPQLERVPSRLQRRGDLDEEGMMLVGYEPGGAQQHRRATPHGPQPGYRGEVHPADTAEERTRHSRIPKPPLGERRVRHQGVDGVVQRVCPEAAPVGMALDGSSLERRLQDFVPAGAVRELGVGGKGTQGAQILDPAPAVEEQDGRLAPRRELLQVHRLAACCRDEAIGSAEVL